MTIDFEEEARITETVARAKGPRPGKLVPLLLASGALVVLFYAGYVSFVKPKKHDQTEREEFKTASKSVHLDLDPMNPPEPPDNKLVIVPPPPAPVAPPPPVVIQAPTLVDEEVAKRAAEEAARRKREEELRLARLQSNMIVVDQGAMSPSASTMAGAGNNPATSAGAADDDPNRKFVASVSSQDAETVRATPVSYTHLTLPTNSRV